MKAAKNQFHIDVKTYSHPLCYELPALHWLTIQV
nr:MAG TPA: hypothetical protein [Caudoviricetes sp.]